MSPLPLENRAFVLWVYDGHRHLDPPANGQAVVYLTGLLEVFISESIILATVSDNSVHYQAINVVKRSKTNINGQKRETQSQTKTAGK